MRHPAAAVPRTLAAAALLASLIAAGCASASPAEESADGSSGFARPGVYLGAYGIQSFEKFHTGDSQIDTGHSDFGVGLKVGYRATPCAAVEVIAESVKGFEVSDGTLDSDLDILNFGISGKYYFLEDRFQPYVLGGVGLSRADVSDFDFDDDTWFLRGGVGVDVYLTTGFALFAEADYNRMMGGGSDLHHIDLQAGLLFRF